MPSMRRPSNLQAFQIRMSTGSRIQSDLGIRKARPELDIAASSRVPPPSLKLRRKTLTRALFFFFLIRHAPNDCGPYAVHARYDWARPNRRCPGRAARPATCTGAPSHSVPPVRGVRQFANTRGTSLEAHPHLAVASDAVRHLTYARCAPSSRIVRPVEGDAEPEGLAACELRCELGGTVDWGSQSMSALRTRSSKLLRTL
ncbi:hypothetical protein BJV78DRAFT_149974 [Lactifluus subvellereus]|nr:hypothetical protein BJV78DRAFT_149974 [Lactifluus subvellereus]